MRLTLLATALAVLLTGCQDVTQPPARAVEAPSPHHISYTDPTVTISGPTHVYTLTSEPAANITLTATVSGGEAPYTYQWAWSPDAFNWYYWDSIYSTSNSVTLGAEPRNQTLYFKVTVTDKWGHTAMDGHTVQVHAL